MSETYTPPPNGFRTFIIVWVTQSISVFGSALTFFAMTIYLTQVMYPAVEQKSELSYALTAVALAFGIPNIIAAPLAGAWADRHDRKRTMLVMDFANGLISLLMVWLISIGELDLWVLIVLIILSSIVSAFHFSAFDTSYAMLVPEKLLPRANGMMQTIWALSGILSPAIAAGILSLPSLARQNQWGGLLGNYLSNLSNGIPLNIMLDAVTFFLASAVLLFLTIPSPLRSDVIDTTGKPKTSIWADVKEGGIYIWRRKPMLWLLGTFTVINFISGAFVLQPLLVKFTLAADWQTRGFTFETALALLGTLASVGGVAGGVIISAWGGLKKKRIFGVVVPILLFSVLFILYGLSPWLYLTGAILLLMDSLTPMMNAHSQAIWQTQTPHHLQGRVFAVRRLIAQFTWPVGNALAGWLGALINPAWVFAVLGFLGAVFCVAQLFNPQLLKVEDKQYLDQLAEQ